MPIRWNHHDLAIKFKKPKLQPTGSYKVCCKWHDDPVGSLHISPGTKGQPVVVQCKAGCDQDVVWKGCCEMMGGEPEPAVESEQPKKKVTRIAITPAPSEPDYSKIEHYQLGKPTRFIEYRDQQGRLHFLNCRFEFEPGTALYEEIGRKTHRPYTYRRSIIDGREGWFWAGPDKGRIPYRLNLLGTGGIVMFSEGEKAADAAAELLPEISHIAAMFGAEALTQTDYTCIAGWVVFVLPDADKIEDKKPLGASVHGFDKLVPMLKKLGCTVHYCRNVHEALRQIGTAPEEHKGFDAADALALGWTRDKFIQYIDLASAGNSDSCIRDFFSDAENFAEIPAAKPEISDNPAVEISKDADFPAKNPINPVADFQNSIKLFKKSQAEKGLPFLPLGYDGEFYFYLSKDTKQVKCISISNHKKNFFLSLVPSPSFWEGFVTPKKSGPDWDLIVSRMMELCHDAGLFKPDLIRGRGAWFDNNHSVLHLGNRLIVDGKPVDILTRPGRYVYELSPPMDGPGEDVMTDAEAARLLDICNMFSWERDVSAIYLAGWTTLAPICGALRWRPHIWISGAKGTGKSTIEERFVLPLLGNTVRYFQGMSTEAGIRQTLNQDALPVMIDEGESQNDRGRARMDAILEMMRQSSSDSEAVTVKGGATGKATQYHIRSMFCLASIGVSIKNAADQSRITKLSLKRSSPEHWSALDEALCSITADTSRRLISRTVQLIPVIRDNAKLLAGAVAKIVGDQRLGDQYGALLAGAESLRHGDRLTKAQAVAIAETYAAEFTKQANDIEHDEHQCLEHLLQQIIRCDRKGGGNVTLSVAELIEMASRGRPITLDQDEAAAVLKRHGLRVDPITSETGGNIKIARTHSQLAMLFKGTPWQSNGWAQFFLRLPGAKVPTSKNGNEVKIRFGGQSGQNAVEVPLSLMEDEQDAAGLFAGAADDVGF